VRDVLERVPGLGSRTAELHQRMLDARLDARRYGRERGEDPPEIAD
jgi:xylulose-5-phosphate/fructose-6-phosphate phosphoketolase